MELCIRLPVILPEVILANDLTEINAVLNSDNYQ